MNVFAGSTNQNSPFRQRLEDRLIAVTAIDYGPQNTLRVANDLIQTGAYLLDQGGSLGTEAFLAPQSVVLLPFFLCGLVCCHPRLIDGILSGGCHRVRLFLLRLRDGWSQVEGDGDGTSRAVAFRPDQHCSLDKTQRPYE